MRISDWSSDVCSSDLTARSSSTRAIPPRATEAILKSANRSGRNEMQRRLPVFTGIALALAATASPVAAQTFAITNAHLLTPGPVGAVQNGTVLVRAGRIAAAGANVAVPSGVRTTDAKGATVTPGLIAVNTPLR